MEHHDGTPPLQRMLVWRASGCPGPQLRYVYTALDLPLRSSATVRCTFGSWGETTPSDGIALTACRSGCDLNKPCTFGRSTTVVSGLSLQLRQKLRPAPQLASGPARTRVAPNSYSASIASFTPYIILPPGSDLPEHSVCYSTLGA